jgi:hypothetical protein
MLLWACGHLIFVLLNPSQPAFTENVVCGNVGKAVFELWGLNSGSWIAAIISTFYSPWRRSTPTNRPLQGGEKSKNQQKYKIYITSGGGGRRWQRCWNVANDPYKKLCRILRVFEELPVYSHAILFKQSHLWHIDVFIVWVDFIPLPDCRLKLP